MEQQQRQNDTAIISSGTLLTNLNETEKTETKKESKLVETLFLGSMAGLGLMIGFSNGISLAKKQDEKSFNKVCLAMLLRI